MKQLRAELDRLLRVTRGDRNIINAILDGKALYPFSVEGQLLEYFLSIGEISYSQYDQMKTDYIQRNQYLELFDMAPRTYGQTWGEQHIRSLFPQFLKATKENLAGAYPDLMVNLICGTMVFVSRLKLAEPIALVPAEACPAVHFFIPKPMILDSNIIISS